MCWPGDELTRAQAPGWCKPPALLCAPVLGLLAHGSPLRTGPRGLTELPASSGGRHTDAVGWRTRGLRTRIESAAPGPCGSPASPALIHRVVGRGVHSRGLVSHSVTSEGLMPVLCIQAHVRTCLQQLSPPRRAAAQKSGLPAGPLLSLKRKFPDTHGAWVSARVASRDHGFLHHLLTCFLEQLLGDQTAALIK